MWNPGRQPALYSALFPRITLKGRSLLSTELWVWYHRPTLFQGQKVEDWLVWPALPCWVKQQAQLGASGGSTYCQDRNWNWVSELASESGHSFRSKNRWGEASSLHSPLNLVLLLPATIQWTSGGKSSLVGRVSSSFSRLLGYTHFLLAWQVHQTDSWGELSFGNLVVVSCWRRGWNIRSLNRDSTGGCQKACAGKNIFSKWRQHGLWLQMCKFGNNANGRLMELDLHLLMAVNINC